MYSSSSSSSSNDRNIMLKGVFGSALLATVGFIGSRYRVAGPSERLIRTGFGIKSKVDISRSCFHIPFVQTFKRLSLSPRTFHVEIETMSKEQITFHLPTVWTIAPKLDDASIQKWAERLIDMNPASVQNFITGIVQGEGRIIAGELGLDELQNQREAVREKFIGRLKPDFEAFGAEIMNANVEELRDTPGQEYFAERRKRALAEASNFARKAVAEATLFGDVAVSKASAETREKKAEYERQATVEENKQLQTVWQSKADLAKIQYESELKIAIAKEQQKAIAEQKKSEFNKIAEEARQQQEIAKHRANNLSMVQVEAEKMLVESKGVAASLVEKALGELKSKEILAQAHFVMEEKKAAAILKVFEAEADGLKKLVDAAGNVNLLNNYLMVKRGAPEQMIQSITNSMANMNPNINITQWNRNEKNEKNEDGSDKLTEPIMNLMTVAPEVAKQMEKLTGYQILPQILQPSPKSS